MNTDEDTAVPSPAAGLRVLQICVHLWFHPDVFPTRRADRLPHIRTALWSAVRLAGRRTDSRPPSRIGSGDGAPSYKDPVAPAVPCRRGLRPPTMTPDGLHPGPCATQTFGALGSASGRSTINSPSSNPETTYHS